MNPNTWIMAGSIGAIFGVITSFWSRVQSLFKRFSSLMIQNVSIADLQTALWVVGVLREKYKLSPFYDRRYESVMDYIRSRQLSGKIVYENYVFSPLVFRNGKWPIFVNREMIANNGGNNSLSPTGGICLTFIRGTLDIDKIIEEAVSCYNDWNWSYHQERSNRKRRHFVKYVPDFQDKENEANTIQNVSAWQYQKSLRLIGIEENDIGLGSDGNVKMLDRLFFPEDMKQLIDEIKLWHKSRDWYRELGIPWKRGWLLHGPGGTGKTALARAFAHDLDMPMYIFNLSELRNMEFIRAWKEMLPHVPCIALIEDIDNVFDGRTNISRNDEFTFDRFWSRVGNGKKTKTNDDKKEESESSEFSTHYGNKLSFDVFLNCLDGVDRSEGIFTIITTNHIDKIDPALGKPRLISNGETDCISTRPGRIDKAIELGPMLPHVKIRMAKSILRNFPEERDTLIADVSIADFEETPAQFQERCAGIAIKAFWDRHNNAQIENLKLNSELAQVNGNGN